MYEVFGKTKLFLTVILQLNTLNQNSDQNVVK